MDFVGDDDVRIIITHADIVGEEAGYQISETKQRLSELLDVKECHITAVGRYTDSTEIEDFIHSTLHDPKKFKVSKEQLAYVSTLSVGARQFNSVIEEVSAKLHASTMACQELSSDGPKCPEVDFVIRATMKATVSMVEEAKSSIFERAKELAPEEQNILGAKIQESLDLPKEIFVKAIISCLLVRRPITKGAHTRRSSWSRKKHRHQGPAISVDFYKEDSSGWKIRYRVNARIVPLDELWDELKSTIKVATHEAQDASVRSKRIGAMVSSSSRRQRKHQRSLNHSAPTPDTAPSPKASVTAVLQRSEPPLFWSRHLSSERGDNRSGANMTPRRRTVPPPHFDHHLKEQEHNRSDSKTKAHAPSRASISSPPKHHQPSRPPPKSRSTCSCCIALIVGIT
jgi:hypothetical protein